MERTFIPSGRCEATRTRPVYTQNAWHAVTRMDLGYTRNVDHGATPTVYVSTQNVDPPGKPMETLGLLTQ